MKLKKNKIYRLQFKNDKIFFERFGISEKFKDIPLKIIYDGEFLRIVDKRFDGSKYFDFGFHPKRFIIKKIFSWSLIFKMNLKIGKTYYMSINKKEASPSLLDAFEEIGNNQILVQCTLSNDKKFFKVIDKRLKDFACFNGVFFLKRFVIEEQLEFDFYV